MNEALLWTGFARAAAHAPDAVCEERLRFAGRPVVFRIVGRELAERTLRPFAHLLDADRAAPEADLSIQLVDGLAGGRRPATPLQARVRTSADGRQIVRTDRGSSFVFDRDLGRIAGRVGDIGRLPIDQLSKPLPTVLTVWYLQSAINPVHAALVSRGDVGALAVGGPGAGKSTTALACAAAGFGILGDDHVGIEESIDGGFVGHSFYSTARLSSSQLARDPELGCGAPMLEVPGEKALLFLAESTSISLVRSVHVRAVLLLERTGIRMAIRPARPAEALLRMAPTSLLGVVGGGAWAFQRLGRLVEQVPAFHVVTNGEADAIPELVDEALARAA